MAKKKEVPSKNAAKSDTKKSKVLSKNAAKSDTKEAKVIKRKAVETAPEVNKKKNKLEPAENLPKIKSIIPCAYPAEYTIQVSNLPDKYKQIEIIEAFNQYGCITFIQPLGKKILLAFLTEEEAEAAARRANNVKRIGGKALKVKKRSAICVKSEIGDRKVFVFCADPLLTEEDIRKHFKGCGKILDVKLANMKKWKESFRFSVVFEDEAAAQAAVKLHNSVLKGKNIVVRLQNAKFVPWYPHRTIVLLNEDGLTNVDGSILREIFGKCGEIEDCTVLRKGKKLAMITFANDADAEKALKLNGKQEKGLKIAVELYATQLLRGAIPQQNNPFEEILKQASAVKRKVLVENIKQGIAPELLKEFFKSCGSVENVTFLPNKSAIIEFSNSDGYCRSFARDNTDFMGQRVSILPLWEEHLQKIT